MNSILSLLQDRSRYLWLGTSNGLVRFDGMNFVLFDNDDAPLLGDSLIMTLYEDRRGTLWCGTDRGDLIGLAQGRFRRHSLSRPGSSRSINAIGEDDRGNLWIGMTDGLVCRPAGSEDRFVEAPDFKGKKVNCISRELDGRLLLGTRDDGMFRLEGEQWRRFGLPGADPRMIVRTLCRTRDGRLWIGTDNGVYVFPGERVEHVALGSGLSDNIICFLEDRDLNLWVGTEGGLYRIAGEQRQRLTSAQGLASNIVYSLREDDEGSLWVGTIDGGLCQLRDEKITTFNSLQGMGNELVRCVCGSRGGEIWIGGQSGYLSRLQAGRLENFSLPDWLRAGTIWSIAADSDTSLWLGTNFGLIRFERGRFQKVSPPAPAGELETLCVLKDRAGRLWAGTWGRGVARLEKGEWTWFTTGEGLPDDRIYCLFEDRDGTVLAGSEAGLVRLAAPGDPPLRSEPLLDHCQVLSLYRDGTGALWIGTRNQGLKVMRGGRLGSITADQGLFDNRVYAILEDDGVNLWLSSERGIFCAGIKDLEDVAWGRRQRLAGRLYTEENGLKSRICNSGQPAGWKSADGRLWFATLSGVVAIDPSRLRPSDRLPPVQLEEVIVDQRQLQLAGGAPAGTEKLPAGSKRFEFKYTALSFIRSNKIAFKYKLEGYDRDWTDAGNRRQAFYNNLKPGRYRFRVMAANADGVWNTAGASFAFFLRPFVYQTWWFLALATLAFAALSVFLWQLLKRYLRAVTFWKKKTQIGHFKILETIGSGGMATVYKAQDLLNRKRIVALKVLREENFHDVLQKRRFKHESLITEQLDHPHIVHIFERGEMDNCWYIAMELLQGVSLARLIKEKGRLPTGTALEIMLQIVEVLRAIHGKDIVHRDLKPENIMISERAGQRHFVKLLDFGLAITPAQSRLTMSGVVMGTIRYLPPERIHNGISSAAGDIYSAGIILYEMVTAAKPFWSEATGEVIHRILETYPLPAREINPAIPPELGALVAAMIDKDPRRRPSLEMIEEELRKLADEDARR